MNPEILQKTVIDKFGIERLNPMQTGVLASDKPNIILLSPTGSGKTLAYTLAIFKRLTPHSDTKVHVVIIAPTRELVRQIADVVRVVATEFELKTLALYGGNSFKAEEASLQGRVPDIIVTTPGRLLDHLKRATLELGSLEMLVFDEYDKTLELGFQEEIEQIERFVNASKKKMKLVLFTSATRLVDFPTFIRPSDYEEICYNPESSVESRLRIVNVPSPTADKLDILAALIRSLDPEGQIIVFVNHRESADRVENFLRKEKISSVIYHGGLDQQRREIALAKFASHSAKVLVSTDLAGRGIDIDGVRYVIHYHPAADKEIWTHRNGRTARVDRTGEVFVITGPEENIPEFVDYNNDYYPDMTAKTPVRADFEMIYFDKGKRDKISKGDIAGFIMKQAEVPAEFIGKIILGLNYALAAVKSQYVNDIFTKIKDNKLKGQRVRATLID